MLAAFLAWKYSGSWEVGLAVLLLIPVFPLWNSRLRRQSRAKAIDTRLEELRGQVAVNGTPSEPQS